MSSDIKEKNTNKQLSLLDDLIKDDSKDARATRLAIINYVLNNGNEKQKKELKKKFRESAKKNGENEMGEAMRSIDEYVQIELRNSKFKYLPGSEMTKKIAVKIMLLVGKIVKKFRQETNMVHRYLPCFMI